MKGCVYIIRSHQTDDVYYGSTMQQLSKRMAHHRSDYKKWLDGRGGFTSSYDILKYNDAYIELVEEINFMNKAELYAREGYYIRENKCVNKNIPNRTIQEWTQDNKDHITEYKKNWYEANKDSITEYKKGWYEANKDKISARQKQKREESKLG